MSASSTPRRWWATAAALGVPTTYVLAVANPIGQVIDTQMMRAVEGSLGDAEGAELLLAVISPASVVAALCLVAAVALAARGAASATAAVVTIVGTLLGSEVLKHLLVRPGWFDDAGNSLPSGHVSAVAAIAVATYVAVPAAARSFVATLGVAGVLATATATTALGWHRPSDAVASVLLSITVGAVAAEVTGTTRSTAGDPAPPRTRLVMVGGVPGAGKSTVLRELDGTTVGVRVVDPEQASDRLGTLLGPRVPYRCYRLMAHATHLVRVVALVLIGPHEGPLVIHETATRANRRAAIGWLATARRWDPALLLLDVSRADAVAGQQRRRRVVPSGSFDQYWRRWQAHRRRLLADDTDQTDTARLSAREVDPWWATVTVVDREAALPVLLDLCSAEGRDEAGAPLWPRSARSSGTAT